jgi:hypothetical protein
MRKILMIAACVAATTLFGCGGGGTGNAASPSTQSSSGAPASASTPASAPSSTVQNQQPIAVKEVYSNYANELTTSVTICVPGTTNCQTINNVLVDTGSFGLRLISAAVTLPLARTTAAAGGTLADCAVFDSGFAFGSVATADIKLAGEVAPNAAVHLIGDTAVGTAPSSCSSQSPVPQGLQTAIELGANGIIGVGTEPNDCGSGCVSQAVVGAYYGCTGTSCTPTTVPLNQQVSNPVSLFPEDNNGVAITLPPVSTAGQTAVIGTMTFGIGTQADNALGSAHVYTLDADDDLVTVYNGATLSGSFIDSGSNGFFFVDNSIPQCSDGSGFYCPASTLSLSAVMLGINGNNTTIDFPVVNADTLAQAGMFAINGYAATGTAGDFDWGLPFFYGRTVFTAINGASTPGGTGPYFAY